MVDSSDNNVILTCRTSSTDMAKTHVPRTIHQMFTHGTSASMAALNSARKITWNTYVEPNQYTNSMVCTNEC